MWPKVAAILLVGYLSLSRAFAYLGIPVWKLFVSEVVIAALFIWGPRVNGRLWPWAALKLPALKRFSMAYVIFFGYGVVQVLHGVAGGYPPLVALRDLTFHYYPIYFFLGLWAGLMRPDFLPKLLRGFAWFNGIYGVFYVLVLNRIEWFFPGVSDDVAPVPIFGQPMYSFVALLGLIAYEKQLWRSWHLLLLNGFVMLGMQVRAEWLVFAVGLIAWFLVTKQAKRLVQAGAILAVFIGVLYVIDFSIPGPESRGGGEISVKQLTDRAVAAFRADTSDANAAAGIGSTESQEATIVWRTVWWLMIWSSAHSDAKTAILGHGYGYPLGDLVPYLAGESIRTPHNEFFYALGYTGWLGVILFFMFEGEILRLLWKVYRTTGDPFGVPYWTATMLFGMFFPLGETPYGAVPLYLTLGWLVSPLLSEAKPVVPASADTRTWYFTIDGAGTQPLPHS